MDAGQGGVVAHRIDADPQRAVGRHRPGDDAVARALGHGTGLARDHRLVDLGAAVDDLAVGGHPAAGAHEHHVAGDEVAHGDGLRPVLDQALGIVGKQRRQRLERSLGLADGLHLLPVAQQHDGDQGGQLRP